MDLPSEAPAEGQRCVALPARLGERWSAAEYAQLVDEIRSGLTVDEIAKAHGRPPGGITAACNRLLPTEHRSSSRRHAPTVLSLYLHEHPDAPLAAIPLLTSRRHRKPRYEECMPLPVPTSRGLDFGAQLEPGDAAALAFEAVSWLDGRPREKQVLRMRLGFQGAPRTLAEIAGRFGVSGERIRQIEARALALLVRQARKPGTPGATLAALLHLPIPDAFDEAFAERVATIVASEFEAPIGVAIPFLLCAAGIASPAARRVAFLARAAEERRRELEKEQLRTAAAERRAATVVSRADAVVTRWSAHASWPATVEPPPERGTLHALRLDGPGEPAGSFHSQKLDRDVLYESGLELVALTVLENSSEVAWYQEQPLTIPYTWEGRQRVYYPDILAATRAGRCLLIEVKPLMNMPVAVNRAKAAAGRAYAHQLGWGWITVDGIHTERDLETHAIPAEARHAIAAGLEAHHSLGWREILELRTESGVSPRDIAAFIIQTGAQLTLEPRYRISASR
ncbi:sigma factor-like helix-turn-helix DNA-binding protein [Microbacterium sp.]|uniref:sigma factor-like helix-turn-helix DNA-binding protein n=1 Tax=Microbacterium sp. TaxID=51671 RepID=UPI0039E70BDF